MQILHPVLILDLTDEKGVAAMRHLLDKWKKTAMENPRLSMLVSWALMWALGTILKIPAAVTALVILLVGYLGQFIWMMRTGQLSGN